MKFSLITAMLAALVLCNDATAQVTGIASPMPTIGATSPLGIGTGSTVSPTGIPLGSTEIASPGVSPAPGDATGTISMPSSSTTCSTLGTAPSGMYGSTATYDGGGMAAGAAAPATAAAPGMSTSSGISATTGMSTTSGILETSGLSGMCGSGSSSITSSSTPTSTSPTTVGGVARTGLPLGSTEISNLGVSSAAAVPTMSVPPMVGTTPVMPTIPTVTFPSAASSATTNVFPCPTTGLAGSSATGC